MSVALHDAEPESHEAVKSPPKAAIHAEPALNRPSRQDLVVTAPGPGPWMAIAVISCSILGFSTAFFLEIGRRPTSHLNNDQVATAPLIDQGSRPAALQADTTTEVISPSPGASGAAPDEEVSFSGEWSLAGERVGLQPANIEEERPSHRSPVGEGQLTSATESPATTGIGEASVVDTTRQALDSAVSQIAASLPSPSMITVRKPPISPEPPVSADLPPLPETDDPAVSSPALAEDEVQQHPEFNTRTDTDASAETNSLIEGEPDAPFPEDLSPSPTAPWNSQPAESPPAIEDSGIPQLGEVNGGFATPVGGMEPLAEHAAASFGFDDPDAPIAVTPSSSPPRFEGSGEPSVPSPTAPPASPRYASSDAIRAFGAGLPERSTFASPTLQSPLPAGPLDTPARVEPQPEQPRFSEDSRFTTDPGVAEKGPGYGVPGVGTPGPATLEGLQSPQVAVEKRGPREIQVGKFARYEILVRNVSSVTAHDVELFDTVPQGTSLVSTTPPASPTAEGTLSWRLGNLEPGNQARVLVEVLPTDEGEVGSVASVRFSAKASVRSLATRPALALVLREPAAIRIGGDVPLQIVVSNPGTGRATGVVLESVLPEGLAHRAGRELEFDIGSLKPGESRTIDLLLATTGPGMHRVDVGVRADGQLEERQTAVVEVTAPTLELTAELPSRRYLQRPATCVLAMANAGTAAARSVELAAQLPPGLKFVSANNAGFYDEKNHRVLWQLEELPPAEIGSVEMVLMPIALGSQQIVSAARSPDGLSDQVTSVLEVEGVAALSFTVIDSEDPIEVDGVTEYLIRVGNQGTKPASNVQVAASMLGDLQPVEAFGPVDHRIENLTVIFQPLARLAPTEEVVFRVQARGRRAGDHRIQVQVTSEDHQTPVTKEEVTRVYADR
jgi:uncharacterized repeat protein (TIGR01451 family)